MRAEAHGVLGPALAHRFVQPERIAAVLPADPRLSVERSDDTIATTLERDPHLGRLLTGRIESGSIVPNAIEVKIRRI